MVGLNVGLHGLFGRVRLVVISFVVLLVPASLVAQVKISSTAAGGAWSSPSTWVGGVVPGDGAFVTVAGPVVIDQNIGSVSGGGVGNITLNGASASLSVAQEVPVTILFGSTGSTDPVGAACGGSAGNPGTCANMYGITIRRGNLDLEGSPDAPVVISTADGKSPVYIRDQASSVLPANITLKYVSINNLGTSANTAYAGIVIATYGINVAVDVEYCQFLNYYRLLQGGTATTVSSSLRWIANSSYGGGGGANGSIYVPPAQYFTSAFVVTDNTDQAPLSSGYYIYSFNLGSGHDVERNAVSGNSAYRRGLYNGIGYSQGVGDIGNRTLRNNLCFNYIGSAGNISCVYLTSSAATDTATVVDGNVSTGAYLTIAVRPVVKNNTVPVISNNWLSEDYDVRADQGVVFIGGASPIIRNNIIKISGTASAAPISIGFFSYNTATNIVFDNNTVIGQPSTGSDITEAAFFGESGYPVYNARARSNIFVNWGYGILDSNHPGSTSTYLVDATTGSGVHHNLTTNCNIPYLYDSGVGFENQVQTAHPNAYSYGDMNGVDPAFVDTTRTPATYDQQVLGGPGTGADLFARLAARSGFGGQDELSGNPIDDLRVWLFAGFTPTNPALQGAGYLGVDMGAVPVSH